MNGMNANVGIGLLVEDIEKMVSFYRDIMGFETSFTGEPKTFPFGIRNFYVADPEGNLLEIGSWGKEE